MVIQGRLYKARCCRCHKEIPIGADHHLAEEDPTGPYCWHCARALRYMRDNYGAIPPWEDPDYVIPQRQKARPLREELRRHR